MPPAVRWLLVLILVSGLAPDLAEVAEAVVHVAVDGHLPHTATDPCGRDSGGEHGCGTTLHRCACCPSQALGTGREVVRLVRHDLSREVVAVVRTLESGGEPAPPFRPPIA